MAKRSPSPQAAAAKLIRAELSAAFPFSTFTVKSRSFSMGNAVDIDWTDGPTVAQVEKITGKYQEGSFDGQQDLYEYSNRRDDIPQAKYVQTQRGRSDTTYRAAVDYLNNHYAGYALVIVERSSNGSTWLELDRSTDKHTGSGWQSDEIHRLLHKTSLVCHACKHAVVFGDAFCGRCGASLTECYPCFGRGYRWNMDANEYSGDPCPTCNGSGFSPLPLRSAA
jgi:hypothetical protein